MTDSRQHNRRFHRVSFDGEAWLACGAQETACRIVDISLHGALVTVESPFEAEGGCTLLIPLAAGAEITMRGRIVRTLPDEGRVSFECTSIDIDSIQQLRRLVELNLGDEAVLHRDLAALYSSR